MKKRINYMYSEWLVVIGTLFCWIVCANDQIKPNESLEEWMVNHSTDGITRFEFVHGNKTHFYEVKLTGIDIDGESMILNKPVISVQKNQVTKHWLPYLKETWIDTEGLTKWSFEINRPDFITDSVKQITLKYDVESDGQRGLTVGSQTFIQFDTDIYGKSIHEFNNPDTGKVNISVFGTRCHNAVSIAGYPNKNKSVVFKLNDKSFPLFTQGYIKRENYNFDYNSFYKSSWDFAKLSEQNNKIQLVVPTEKLINDQLVDSINIFQQKKSNEGVVNSNQVSSANMSMVKVDEKDIFGFIKTAGYWHQIMVDEINLNRWKSDKKLGINHLKTVKHASSSFGNLAEDHFFGKSMVIDGDYFYAISNGSEFSKIVILKKEGKQWIKQDPIVIQNTADKLDPRKVSREVSEVIVKNDLMVVPMEVTSYRTPKSTKDNQSLGRVRIYRKVNNHWLFEKSLIPELGNSEDGFGVVVTGDDMVMVSASNFDQDNQDSLNGLVHIFKYESGQWKKPVVIKPPSHAKDSGYFDNGGFGSQLQLQGDDLYVNAGSQGYSSNNANQSSTSVNCPYFDSYGVIYHYRKVRNKWKLLHEIKSKDGASSLIGPMLANSSGLYFLSLNYVNSLPEIYLKHYSDGKIKWKEKISY